MRKDVLSVIFLSIVMFMGIAISFNYLGSLSITGFVFGTANVTVGQTVDITLTIGNLDFGSINIGQTNNTTDFSPPPFVIENIGNTDVNITIYATNLWIGTNSQNPSYFYQFNTTINETGVVPNPLTDLANTTASTAFINVTNSTQVTGGLPPAKVVKG